MKRPWSFNIEEYQITSMQNSKNINWSKEVRDLIDEKSAERKTPKLIFDLESTATILEQKADKLISKAGKFREQARLKRISNRKKAYEIISTINHTLESAKKTGMPNKLIENLLNLGNWNLVEFENELKTRNPKAYENYLVVKSGGEYIRLMNLQVIE